MLGDTKWRAYDIVSLSSGLNASEDVQQDVLTAKDVGRQKPAAFIEEILKRNKGLFYDSIKNNNLKTFTFLNLKKTLKIKDKDVIIRGDRDFVWKNIDTATLREKYPYTELFLVRIFLYSDWIWRFTP